MDNNEVALELLKLFLQMHRERVELDELVDAYLYIREVLEHGHGDQGAPMAAPHGSAPPAPGQAPAQQPADDDSLFDFKQPLSASDKDA
ncbi:MAG: hypothetical protein GXN93_00785 [Candidatus Diapherotrites archaeon]|nr:hypothetical protein [Candidatus Diapherotrites archaeon]